ncbi:MAG: pyridoxal-phosphate dependent enzyme, partial [Pyrinomonadaceae bacterium]|nr:pyridoxal-phosphate dependent enzyme [Pyrinomonadaceae bacterium]
MINDEHDRRSFLRRASMAALVAGFSTATSAQSSITNTANIDLDTIPRLPLTTLPTACNKMHRLSGALGGPALYIKRDDVMEIAHGGNKTRKLEFALAEALNQGANCIITQGGLQSNHVRQTVSAAAKTGYESHVVLSVPASEKKAEHLRAGNYLLDKIMGAKIYVTEGSR